MIGADCNWPGDSPCNRRGCSQCAIWQCVGECERGDCDDCDRERPDVLELAAEEEAALAEVPTRVLDMLAQGNETSLIGAIARARHGGVRS